MENGAVKTYHVTVSFHVRCGSYRELLPLIRRLEDRIADHPRIEPDADRSLVSVTIEKVKEVA